MNELENRIKTDPYLRFLGIQLDELREGFAQCSLVITENMLNFLGVPHGGLIFSLADGALSAASNSDHTPSYAINVSGSFLSKVQVGELIIATAQRVHFTRKTALYRMEVQHKGQLIATFNGTVYRSIK